MDIRDEQVGVGALWLAMEGWALMLMIRIGVTLSKVEGKY